MEVEQNAPRVHFQIESFGMERPGGVQKPFSSSPVGSISGYIGKQHFLVRLLIFTISMNVLCFASYKGALKAEKEIGCDDLVFSMLPMCKGLMSIRTQVTQNYKKLLNILFY